MTAPRVFIVYAPDHADEHTASVKEFATKLRSNGVDAVLDVWSHPDITTYGVTQWAIMEMEKAEKVLVCGTSTLNSIQYTKQSSEYRCAYMQIISHLSTKMTTMAAKVKYIPVVLAGGSDCVIPALLYGKTLAYHMPGGFDALLRRIFNIVLDDEKAPPIGPAPVFPQNAAPDWKAILLSDNTKVYDEAITVASKCSEYRIDKQGNTLLHVAANVGAIAFLKYLDQSAVGRHLVAISMHTGNYRTDHTSFHLAVMAGNKEFIRKFRQLENFSEILFVRDAKDLTAADIAAQMYPNDPELRWLAGDVNVKWPPPLKMTTTQHP